VGCSQKGSKNGVYIGEEGSYLEIKSDGYFFAKNIDISSGTFEAEDSRRKGGGNQMVGKYQWEEGGITFIFEGGKAVRARLIADTLMVGRGSGDQKWVYWKYGKSGMEYEEYEQVLTDLDEIRSELRTLTETAHQYFWSNDGSEGSYVGFVIPPSFESNPIAKFEIVSVKSDEITITATSSKGYGTVTKTLSQEGYQDFIYSGKFKH
jgi:hypothetical protein